MKRRLTLAFGCLACAIPSMAASVAPIRSANVSTSETRRFNLLDATRAAHSELEQRGLAEAHSIASVVCLKGAQVDTGHYDVRIEPSALLADGVRLRGFSVKLDGSVAPVNGFRTTAD